MNKKLIITVLIVGALICAGFVYLLLRNKPEPTTAVADSQSQSPKPETTPEIPAPHPQETAGTYQDYTEEAVAATKGQKILFFHAAWCPQCRELETSIKSGKIPKDVTIFKVDYDSHQKLRQKYGVSLQTTLVSIDDNANEIKKFVAYDQPTLEALIKHLL